MNFLAFASFVEDFNVAARGNIRFVKVSVISAVVQ